MVEVEQVLDLLIEGYTKKDITNIDNFMKLFSDDKQAEMIGIGATVPGEYEWFRGKDEIKEIIISDWTHWGNVIFDKNSLVIHKNSETAWFRVCVQLEQTESSEETWEFFKSQMLELLTTNDGKAADKMFNATHFGMRRIYERNLGKGHMWPMIITGVLQKEKDWRFHTLHWSMPVE